MISTKYIKKAMCILFILLINVNIFACKVETKTAISSTPRNRNKTINNLTDNNKNTLASKSEIDNNYKLTEIEYIDKAKIQASQNQIYSVMSSKKWSYGRTPIEWVFVEADKQIVSNYKPNGSKKFAVTSNVSSGKRGCFVPILSGTENYSEQYEGRFFCFDDTTKDPTNLQFTNSISDLLYDGKRVGEILSKVMNYNLTQYGIIETKEGLINIIYATDLDEIIKNNY